jgi:hypothetical protein
MDEVRRSRYCGAGGAEMNIWEDPNHPGNKIRPAIKCVGCGNMGCVTMWGPWCFECNVERMRRIDRQFSQVRAALKAQK